MPTPPRFDLNRPRPDFAYLVQLADEVIATLGAAVQDADQRMLLIGEARDLVERIQTTLVKIERADPTWAGWAVARPPLGTITDRRWRGAGAPWRGDAT